MSDSHQRRKEETREALQCTPWAAEAVRRLLSEALRESHASEATLWVEHEPSESLVAAFNVGPNQDRIEGFSVAIASSLVGMVLSSAMATTLGADEEYNRDLDAHTGVETRAMAAAPVTVGDEPIGVLSVVNPDGGRVTFGADELDAVEWKAYLLGLVLLESRQDAD